MTNDVAVTFDVPPEVGDPASGEDAVVTAILEGRVEPCVRETGADGVMRTAQRNVHRYIRQ